MQTQPLLPRVKKIVGPRAVLSLRISLAELHRIQRAAKLQATPPATYIRCAALTAAALDLSPKRT